MINHDKSSPISPFKWVLYTFVNYEASISVGVYDWLHHRSSRFPEYPFSILEDRLPFR
jgi:NADH:ubiquinone oxidoreductase subunit